MPNHRTVFVDAVLALDVLALLLALSVVPAPWIGWFR